MNACANGRRDLELRNRERTLNRPTVEVKPMQQREQDDPVADERELAEQWVAGGTMPDPDETWSVPIEDPDATWPVQR